VYEAAPDGRALFHPLPAPSDEDSALLARAACRKVTRYLAQLTGEDKNDQLTLDYLANASVQGLVATGPRRGCRVLRLGGAGADAEAAWRYRGAVHDSDAATTTWPCAPRSQKFVDSLKGK
jgi:hypothetical protein